jgi:histidinol dehydrogenase
MQTLIWKTLSPAQQADVLTRPALSDEADIGAVVRRSSRRYAAGAMRPCAS